jgi:hypothetical protein
MVSKPRAVADVDHGRGSRCRPADGCDRRREVSLFAKPRTETHLPGFDGAAGSLNSEPPTPDGPRGKVFLVDFWTYTCINWLRTLGYVRAWHEK